MARVTLSENKRRLFEQYARGSLREKQASSQRTTANGGEPVVLSLAEEQIWRRAQKSLGLPLFYNETVTVHRRGALDPAVLEQALLKLIERHENWRTTFTVLNDAPIRVIHPAPDSIPMSVADLREFPEKERDAEARRRAAADLCRPFDLENGPLVRFTLARLEDEYYKLFVSAHQITLDGVTAYNVFYPELVELYNSLIAHRPTSLPPLTMTYSDYVLSQRRQIRNQVLARQLEYWRKQFSGGVSDLRWPSSHETGPHSFSGRIFPFLLRRKVASAVKRMSATQNSTLFATLLAAFAALLHCYTKQDDIVIGTVTPAGRDSSRVQRLMGYFLNPVAIRTRMSGETRFCELMQSTREAVLGALIHDDAPYEGVVREVDPEGISRVNPLFKVAASLEPSVPDVGAGWDLTPMDVESGGTRWPLYFVWEDRPNGISGRVQYNPELFDHETVSHLVTDFQTLLELIADTPTVCLSDLPPFAASTQGLVQ